MVDHGVNFTSWPVLQKAVGTHIVESQLCYTFDFAASQDISNQVDAYIIAQLVVNTPDAGENHLGFLGDVHGLVDAPASSAVSADLRMLLPEVFQNVPPETGGCFAVAHHGVQPLQILLPHSLPLRLAELFIFGAIFNQEPGNVDIPAVVEQNAVCVSSITACPARFLIVGFDALWHIVVDNKTDVGLVNSHAEGIGGNHNGSPVVEKILLVGGSLLLAETRVVPYSSITMVLEPLADILHLFSGGTVDDAAFSPTGREQG